MDKLVENLEEIDEIPSEKEFYDLLIKILKKYVKLDEKYYDVIACWILGAKFHDEFISFPYLFLNAAKQSGKSRLLKLLSFLIDGTYTVSLTEAVLFRNKTALFVDEVESITRKEKQGLRELLNMAYKKGGVVQRVEKKGKKDEFVTRTFELFRAVALANIEGMDDVLEDRCIRINLERCFDKEVTRRMELFEFDNDIKVFKSSIYSRDGSNSELSVVSVDEQWVKIYIKNTLNILFNYYNNNTQSSLNSLNSLFSLSIDNSLNSFDDFLKNKIIDNSLLIINKINETDILGRDLEIFMPLFIIGSYFSINVFERLLTFSIEYSKKRQEINIIENRDVIFMEFLYKYLLSLNENEFVKASTLVKEFLQENEDEKWLTTHWIGKFFKRHEYLVIEKRRISTGVEYRINKQKMEIKAKEFGFSNEIQQPKPISTLSTLPSFAELGQPKPEEMPKKPKLQVLGDLYKTYNKLTLPLSLLKEKFSQEEIEKMAEDGDIAILSDDKFMIVRWEE